MWRTVWRRASVDHRVRWSAGAALALVGVVVAVAGGSVATGRSVVAGDPVGAFVRFGGALLLAGYYLYLFHLSQGRRFFGR